VRLRAPVELAEQQARLGADGALRRIDRTVFIGGRSNTRPPSHTALPATLRPPPLTYGGRSWRRVKPIPRTTSDVS
jgi:hypothetical protein